MIHPDPDVAFTPENSPQFDVAIVGAGPAGAAAALALGDRGLRIGLIEKAVPPRAKTCGGGVVSRAVAYLPIDFGAVVERHCFSADFVHHGPDLRFTCRRDRPLVSMVMRDRFDHLIVRLAQQKGVQLFAGTAVLEVAAAPEHVCLTTNRGEVRARYVIAADGAGSVIARKTGRPELRHVVPALECEVTLSPEAMAPWMQTARFDFGFVPSGYGWVFPKRDHLSIGVGTTRRGAAHLPETYRRYLEMLGIGRPWREERKGWVIPCRPRAGLFGVPRVLFVGDAAGLADPVTAEGISNGILSGKLAAQAIIDGRFADAKVKETYRKTLEKNILRELRVARWLAWILYDCPRLRGALFRRHGQPLCELMTQIVTGESTYVEAVGRPSHYLRLLRRR